MFINRPYIRIIAEIVAIIATVEVAVMFLLPVIAPDAGELFAAILDAACLSLIAGPMIAWRARGWAERGKDRGIPDRAAIGRAWLAPIAVVAAGAILTTLVTAASLRNLRYIAQDNFNPIADRLEGEIERRVNLFVYGLRGMRGTFVVSKSVERDKFARYAGSRNLPVEFPGAIGQGFIQRVPRADLDAFVEQSRADGAPQFAVKTSGDAADLFVIKFIEPMARNLPALGYDIGSESNRREAAERAMRTGEPSLTAPIALVQDTASGVGFLYLLPVYRNGAPTTTEADRIAACVGWVYMPISAAEAFARIDKADAGQVDIEVFDGAVVRANNVFDADQHLGNDEISDHTYAGRMFERRTTVAVGGRTWTMVTSSTPRFDALHVPREAWAIAAVGTLVTFGLAIMIFVLGTGRSRAVRMAQAMTADLRRHADVAERTTNAVVITDVAGKIVWVNAGFTRVSGYSLEEVRGKRPGGVLQCEKTDPAVVAEMRQAIKREQPFKGEILNRAKDGREYWLDLDIQPLRDPAGSLTGFMAIESDVTATRIVRERLRSIFSAMAEGIVLQDTSGTIIECNAAAEQILGLTLDQMMGRNAIDPRWKSIREDGSDFPGHEHPAMVTLRTGKPVVNEPMGICTPDGQRRWITVSTQPICDAAGNMTAVVASFADQTMVREQQRRMDLVVKGAGLGTWDWNVQTGVTAFNERWAQMLGYELAEIEPNVNTWERLVHPDDKPRVMRALTEHMEGRSPEYSLEHRLRRKDGSWAWVFDAGLVIERDAAGKPLRAAGIHLDVSASKELEESLVSAKQSAENALREIAALRSALDEHSILSVADRSGRILDVNKGFCAISGYSSEELVGQDHRMLNSGTHPKSFWVDMWKTIATGHAWRGEVCNRAKDGSLYWVDSTIVPFFGEGGRIEKYVSIRFDITARKQAEVELQRITGRFELATRAGGVGTWDYDVINNTVVWDGQMYRLYGVSKESFGGAYEAWQAGVHPDDRVRSDQEIQAALSGAKDFDTEFRVLWPDGSVHFIRAIAVVQRDETGQPTRMVGTNWDVTSQRESAVRLQAMTESLEEAQAVARMGNWSFDLETGLVKWSKQVYDLFGRNPEDGPPDYRGVLADYAPDDASRLDAAVKACLTDGTGYSLVMQTAQGNRSVRYVRGEGRARLDATGEVMGLFGTVADVTGEVEREEALRDAQAKAEAANQSKSEFLANMSHEIRTPMTAILGYTDLLAEHGSREEAPRERLEYIDTIKRNGEHLLSIINDILDVSKIEAGKMTVEAVPTRPDQIVHDVLSLMDVKAKAKGITLKAVYETAIPETIPSDPVRLRQILVNLVGNAIKFTEIGGVSIKVGVDTSEPPCLRFDVEDTGIGLTPEQTSRLFGAFVQADTSTTRKFGGTGLGLRISKSLAQMLGGDIAIQSEFGKGSTFSLTIATGAFDSARMVEPGWAVVVAPSPDVTTTPKATPLPLKGVRLILAEDGPDNVRLISFHLRKAGADVRTVENGKQAVEALTIDGTVDGELIDPPLVDLLLTDMQMPEMDGYTATRLLRAKGCTLPIVALTAHAMSGDAEKCIAAGCDSYATKPIDRAQLIDVCRRAADGKLRGVVPGRT